MADLPGNATVDWNPLGDIFVKKFTCYEFKDLNLGDKLVAIAPYGGPIALMKSPLKMPQITIHTQSAGETLSNISLEGGRVVGMGWTSSENLICVFEDGSMIVFDIEGCQLYVKLIARELRDQRVLECKFFHTAAGSSGFAVMTYSYKFFVVGDSDRSKDDIRCNKVFDLPNSAAKPSCWAVMPKENQCCIVAGVEDKIYLLDPLDANLQIVSCKGDSTHEWVEVAVSLDGKAVSLVDSKGYLWGGSSDFSTCETEFDLQSPSKVLQMQWAGSDFFVIVLDRMIFVKGFSKHWCKYALSGRCVLLPEIDGVRLLTTNTCEFMQRVTKNSLAVLRIGSMDPGALLNDAYKEYEGDESHKADEYIRFIKDQLSDGVCQCIFAAGEEFQPNIQKSLLKAANFGKGFLGPEAPNNVVNNFVETCHHLRVVNYVRNFRIGIPITLRQYYRKSPKELLDRLTNRKLYEHAFRICQYLKLSESEGVGKVFREWALMKVRSNMPEKDVAAAIIKKFQEVNVSVSFAELARAAKACGRHKLAAELLEHEVYAKDQVPLLIEMEKADAALDKAIESGDPQLVYTVLNDLKQNKSNRYLNVFHHRPVAAALYRKLCKEIDPEQLLRLYRQESDFLEAGCYHFAQSFIAATGQERGYLEDAQTEFRDGQNAFYQRAVEDHARLVKEQKAISPKLGFNVAGLSLFDTVLICVKKRHGKVAEQLRKDFKLSDNLYWWAKVKGLVHIGDYKELELFARQKKPPLGYKPLVELCIQHGSHEEACKYVLKCTPEEKYRFYMEMKNWMKAAEVAFQERSVEKLNDVAMKAKGKSAAAIGEQINLMLSKLGH